MNMRSGSCGTNIVPCDLYHIGWFWGWWSGFCFYLLLSLNKEFLNIRKLSCYIMKPVSYAQILSYVDEKGFWDENRNKLILWVKCRKQIFI